MSAPLPVQKFRLGDRVRPKNDTAFVIDSVAIRGRCVMYSAPDRPWCRSDDLTLCLERLPYVASERRAVARDNDRFRGKFPHDYRCETDTELAARHVIERAAYDAQGDEA